MGQLLNLKGEMVKRRLNIEDIARVLGIHKNTAANKVNGLTPFTVDEAIRLHKNCFQDLELKYLFQKETGSRVRIGSKEFSEIIVTDDEGNLLASITEENIIEEKNCIVTCVPVDS